MNGSSNNLDMVRTWAAISGAGRWGLCLALATLLLAAGPAGAINVMPIGDSITEGDGSTSGIGFRDLLHTQLNTIGTYDFVGSNGSAPYQGHFQGGATVEEFYPGTFGSGHGTGTFNVTTDMNTYSPDIAFVHLGTNDINSHHSPYAPYSSDHGVTVNSSASGELGDLVKYLLQWHDGTYSTSLDQVVLSRIIPLEGRTTDIETFNREVVRMVLDFRNGAVTGSPEPVYLADHYTPFNNNPNLFTGGAGDWMSDAIHPNDLGYGEVSDVYFNTIDQVLNDPGPPDAVTDLAVATVTSSSMLLVWTNTGDSGQTGNPSYADLRYSTGSISGANFPTQNQAGDYATVGSGGAEAGTRVTGLSASTSYNFAVKLMDDASNLSSISNVTNYGTIGEDDIYTDNFNRTVVGTDWATDPDFSVNGTELVNGAASSGPEQIALFLGSVNPASAQFIWAGSADPSGIDQAGFACRMTGTNPATTNGYIVFRNVEAGQGCTLFPIVNGQVAGGSIDTASPTVAAPGPGDEFKVLLSSDSNGHHFAVYIRGELDAVLTDASKVYGNGDYYCGYIGSGGLNDNIDNWRTTTVTTNQPPLAFALLAPSDSSTVLNLNPFFWWEEAFDPNPGDQLIYSLFYSTSPTFSPSVTSHIDSLTVTSFGVGTLLQANARYYWKVRATDPYGASTWSNETWDFVVDNVQQLGDNFERAELGLDWAADPGFSIVGGELSCTTSGFDDIAVYGPISTVRGCSWTWAETAVLADLNFAGCVFLDGPSQDANGYFIFRQTTSSERWSIWEVQNGLLTGSLNIDTAGRLPVPWPGDVMRVNYTSTPAGNIFECYINGEFDARLVDSGRLQVTGSTIHAGMILGQNRDNNIEEFIVLGPDANLAPAPFALLTPGDGSTLFTLAPTLSWEEAVDPNPGDIITYTVLYGLDPVFTIPETLTPTTSTSTAFTGTMFYGVPYYWTVLAEDSGGAIVWSPDIWSFSLAETLSVADAFDRTVLGSDWSGDSSMQIVGGELSDTNTGGGTDMAIYRNVTNPDAVQFDWGDGVNNDGIAGGGIALRLNEASHVATGYWVRINPMTSVIDLWTIINGASGNVVDSTPRVGGSNPGSGDEFRVVPTSDAGGHHFDTFVNGEFYGRVTDPNKVTGNWDVLYAGVALRAALQNNVDNFMMTAFIFGPPPQDFALLSPAHLETAVLRMPELSWVPASGTGTGYIIYVGTDSVYATSDSVVVQTETTISWPDTLAAQTTYTWRVRATDGEVSVFNLNGWHVFTTGDLLPVELSRFEASGEADRIVLSWAATSEINHLGYHVWRSDVAETGYERLTAELLRGRSPYQYVDEAVVAGRSYYYRLEAVDRTGDSEFHGPVRGSTVTMPLELALRQNVPNPFNPATTIGFVLEATADVHLTIYDVGGRAVRHLVEGRYPLGIHEVMWDGRGDGGSEVSTGVYFYRLTVGDWLQTRKMLLIR